VQIKVPDAACLQGLKVCLPGVRVLGCSSIAPGGDHHQQVPQFLQQQAREADAKAGAWEGVMVSRKQDGQETGPQQGQSRDMGRCSWQQAAGVHRHVLERPPNAPPAPRLQAREASENSPAQDMLEQPQRGSVGPSALTSANTPIVQSCSSMTHAQRHTAAAALPSATPRDS
jgi:hypothetical protein